METAAEIISRHAASVDASLRSAVHRLTRDAPALLVEAIEYSLFAGGKRLRPALLLECAQAVSGRAATSSALAAAGAIELIHTFSLVHDDLPAMDDDDLRRGRPTSHRRFDEATAILAGDAMTTLAFELIAMDADPALAPRLIVELAAATGPAGMIGGQMLDIVAENQSLALEELSRVHSMKTGALIIAAARMGALCGSSAGPTLNRITAFGRHLGLAFQIHDDILDLTATPEQTGKATGKDRAHGKNTFPSLLGLDEARRQEQEHLQQALNSLQELGPAADGLRTIARFVIERGT